MLIYLYNSNHAENENSENKQIKTDKKKMEKMMNTTSKTKTAKVTPLLIVLLVIATVLIAALALLSMPKNPSVLNYFLTNLAWISVSAAGWAFAIKAAKKPEMLTTSEFSAIDEGEEDNVAAYASSGDATSLSSGIY